MDNKTITARLGTIHNTLETVSVSGRANLNAVLASMIGLENLIRDINAPEQEPEIKIEPVVGAKGTPAE